MKLQDAPKQIATKNGRGSTLRIAANITPMGVNITATAAFEMNADSKKVTPYKTARIITGLTFSIPPINIPNVIINSPIIIKH